jgi:hypothetical protein
VVAKTSTAFSEERRTLEEALEVGGRGGQSEVNQAVVSNEQAAAKRDMIGFAAEAELVRAVGSS